LILDDKTYTYADLLSRTRNLAASLLERGINPGDRVAFLLPNCPEIVVCYYACFKIGAIAVPLNIRFDADLLRYVINHSGARVLISEPELFTQVEKIRVSLPEVEQYYLVCGHSDFNGVALFSELLEATSSVVHLPVFEESSPAAILTLDGSGKVLAANSAANGLFAIPDGQVLHGRPIGDYLPLLADALRLDSREGFRTAAQCQGRNQNGEIFLANTWFSSYVAPEGARLAAIVVDASEEMRDREEQNLRQLTEGNRIAAAAVSHEVRNLCVAISLVCANLKDKDSLAQDEDGVTIGSGTAVWSHAHLRRAFDKACQEARIDFAARRFLH